MDYSTISLQKEVSEPLYRQLADQLQQALARGDLRPAEQLPPIRKLAQLLSISPITVSQAYEELALMGVASGSVGRGTFLLPLVTAASTSQRPDDQPFSNAHHPSAEHTWMATLMTQTQSVARSARLQQLLQRAAQRWHEASPLINFSSGNPDAGLFALDRWHLAMNQAGVSLQSEQGRTPNILQYGASVLGDSSLRAFLVTYVQRYGIHVPMEQILLTNGTQQGLDLVARSFLLPGATVFVDQFSYIAALDIFEQYGAHLQSVPFDEHGMRVDLLEELLVAPQPQPRFIYTIPTGHSPSGACLSEDRRAQLRDLAQRYNLLIIEDDAFNELYYQGKTPVPAIWCGETEGRVIYLKSFSKTIFPGVRSGCLIAHPTLLSVIARRKQLSDRTSSIPLARAVFYYIDASAYEHELLRARSTYRHRRDILLAALEREVKTFGCSWIIPQAGFNLLLFLPAHLDEMRVVEEAAAHGLAVAPGYFFTPMSALKRQPALRLIFADKSPALLEEGILRLASALRILMQTGSGQDLPHFTTGV